MPGTGRRGHGPAGLAAAASASAGSLSGGEGRLYINVQKRPVQGAADPILPLLRTEIGGLEDREGGADSPPRAHTEGEDKERREGETESV